MGIGQASVSTLDDATNDTHQSRHSQNPVDVSRLAAIATQHAIDQALDTLRSAHDRSVLAGHNANQREPASISDLGPRLQVDLQIARVPSPILGRSTPKAGSILDRLSIGFHGLRLVSQSQQKETWSWPASALAANLSSSSQMTQLLSQMGFRPGGDSTSLTDLDLRLEQFEVIHLVRPAPDLPVTRVIRGNHVLPPVSLSSRSVDSLADRLANHLTQRLRTDGQMAGTYLPSADRYDPPIASPPEAALAAYALGRRSALWTTRTAVDSQAGVAASQAARTIVDQLIARLDHPPRQGAAGNAQALTATRALLLLTILESPGFEDYKPHRDTLADHLLRLRNDDGTFRSAFTPDASRCSDSVQALLIAALASLYEQRRDEPLRIAVTQSLDEMTSGLETEDWVAVLPWLAWAQLRMARLEGSNDTGNTTRPSQRLDQLAKIIAYLKRRQISSPPGSSPGDVVGGFDLRNTSSSKPPAPDWHSARILGFLSSVVLQSFPAAEETPGEQELLLDCGLAARFIAQLMFDEVGCFYVRSKADAMGGVRRSLWDNRLTLGASSMALLAVTELQETIAQWSQKNIDP